MVKSCETILPTEPPVERRVLARVLAVTKSLHELQIEGKARGRTLGFFRRIWGVLLPKYLAIAASYSLMWLNTLAANSRRR